MHELIDNLYEQFLFSKVGQAVFFWAGQDNLLCWLLGHTNSIHEGKRCERCGMTLCFFLANRKEITAGGLFLLWRWQVIVGWLASKVLNEESWEKLEIRYRCSERCHQVKQCPARILK